MPKTSAGNFSRDMMIVSKGESISVAGLEDACSVVFGVLIGCDGSFQWSEYMKQKVHWKTSEKIERMW